MNIKTVTVLGANGTMGANISAIFASFGDAKVYMISRDMEKSRAGVAKAIKSVRADSIGKNLIPADYSMLEECVKQSDLIFESAAENLAIKQDLTTRVGRAAKPDAYICSGTSGLSIQTLAECLPEPLRRNYYGVHMFNPPYNLTLCELISSPYAEAERTAVLREYLQKVLLRTVVDVKDSPAFLGNRIGFQFINEALIYAEKYQDNGGVDYIDAILGTFTGRAMAPLTTADFVGLDVHKAIVDNVYFNTSDYAHETFALPSYVQQLIDQNKLGRKVGEGLYKMEVSESGKKRLLVYDIANGEFREKMAYVFPFAEAMKAHLRNGEYKQAVEALLSNHSEEAKICLHFLLNYIVYSLMAASEVGFCVSAADDVMATGFNWCPPLAMAQALQTAADLRALVKAHVDAAIDTDALLDSVVPSRYDYRPYFKSGK